VAGAGAVGGLLRTATAQIDTGWPWPTLGVNIAGAFLLGVAVRYGRRHWPPVLVAAVGVGLLGALTTFSTLAGQLWDMQAAGDWESFGVYVAASVAGGWLAAAAGLRVGRALS
jgi:CrcB protein